MSLDPHQVQPIPFYPFYLAAAGVEYQTMPWFSIQLIRRAELAAARTEWCAMIGVSTEEYDEGEKDSRVARRRHAVNAAAPELTELFLEAREFACWLDHTRKDHTRNLAKPTS